MCARPTGTASSSKVLLGTRQSLVIVCTSAAQTQIRSRPAEQRTKAPFPTTHGLTAIPRLNMRYTMHARTTKPAVPRKPNSYLLPNSMIERMCLLPGSHPRRACNYLLPTAQLGVNAAAGTQCRKHRECQFLAPMDAHWPTTKLLMNELSKSPGLPPCDSSSSSSPNQLTACRRSPSKMSRPCSTR